jgi:DNA polymerase III subunit gamma/tau
MAEAPSDPAQPGTAGTAPVTASGAGAQAALALYRKYRPATFAELRGQEQVTEPLRQALRSGRINHAYLFSGPRGCGKTSSARILARSLNCVKGPTPDPCGECESCVALAPSGPGSIDVIEIDAASHGGVDDARDLRERAFYAPVAGRFKVYIIDEAHMVTQQGFNALLKLVEEPPPHLKFIFATTEPEKVIPTIRSRTHHYPFRLVPPATLRQLLEDILVSEGVAFNPDVLPLVVRAGAGSVRDSLSVLDQLVAGSDESGLTYERAIALLGYTDATLLDEIADAFAAADGASVFRVVNRIIEGGHEPRRFAADMLDRFRDLIVLASVPDAAGTGLLDAPPDRLELMSQQAARFGLASLTRAAEIMSNGLDQMRGATSPRLLLELMCAQVLLPTAGTDEKALLARLERLERGAGSLSAQQFSGAQQAVPPPAPAAPPVRAVSPAAPAPSGPATSAAPDAAPAALAQPEPAPAQAASPPPASPAAAVAPAEPDPPRETTPAAPPPEPARAGQSAGPGLTDTESFGRNWDAVLEAIKRERRVAWMLLSNATVLSLDGNVLTLRFARDGDVKGFTSSGCDADLKRVLSSRFGLNVTVKALSANDPAAAREARPRLNPVPAPAAAPSPAPASRDSDQPGSADAGGPGGSRSTGAPPPGSAAPGQPASMSGPAAPAGAGSPSAPATATGPTTPGGSSGGRPEAPRAPRFSPDIADAIEVPDADDLASPGQAEISGMDLIQRELGGQIIGEIED